MFGSKGWDLVVGLDVHLELVPTPAGPVPTPFPAPFFAVLMDPMQLVSMLLPNFPIGLVGIALDPIGAAVNWVADKIEPGIGGGPVHINGVPATNTNTNVSTQIGVPHIVIPPGIMFSTAGRPVMTGDGKLPFGSSSVWINGRRAVRALMDPVFTCSDPMRMPTLMIVPIPLGPPVLVGGAPVPDLQAIISGAIRAWVTARIKNFVGPALQKLLRGMPSSRLRNLVSRYVCFVTGHPVDVATGRMFTSMTDWELPGPLPLKFERVYSSAVSDRDGALGFGWNHTLDESVWLERGRVVFRGGDGREIQADTMDLPGRVMRKGDSLFEPFSRLTFRRVQDGWEIEEADGLVHEFRRIEGDPKPERWRLTKLRTRDGHEITLRYDEHGALAEATDCGGRVIRFEHDPRGRLVRVALPHPTRRDEWITRVKYSYSKDGNLIAVEDALGHATRYEYAGHLMVRETDRTGLSFYFGYDGTDSQAWCVRTWGDGGIYDHVIEYDKVGKKTFVTNSLGHTTVYRMNEALAVIEVTDAHGGSTKYEYDDWLRKTAETDPLGNATKYEYDERGNKTRTVGPDGATVALEYDERNLAVRAVDAIGGEWRWAYDEGGNVVEAVNPLGEQQRFEYAQGLLSAHVNTAGHRTGFTHDRAKSLIWVDRANGARHRYDYDAQGRQVYERDARGAEWRFKYDDEGHLLRTEGPTGDDEHRRVDAEGNLVDLKTDLRHIRFGYAGFHKPAWREEAGTRIALSYDTEGQLTEVRNEADEPYTFALDALGRVVTEVAFDGVTRSYRYDAAGQVIEVLQPDGKQDKLKYDPAGRFLERRHADGTFQRFTYRLDGALIKAENETGVVAFDRDGLGRIVKEQQGDYIVRSRYGADGLRSEMETSLGAAQSIQRDQLGQVQSLALGKGHDRPIIEFERDAGGLEIGRRLPGQIRIEWERDLAGRPTERRTVRTNPRGIHEKESLTYQWAGADQIRCIVSSRAGPTNYTHDARGRLIREEHRECVLHREMDEVGNIYRSANRHDRRFGRGGRLETASGTAYAYDVRGSLVAKNSPDGTAWTYIWNGAGLLKEVGLPGGVKVSFEYDVFARRTRKTTLQPGVDGRQHLDSDVRFVWDGDDVVHELQQGTVSSTWYWQPGRPSPIAKATAHRHWTIGSDHLGTPTEVFDDSGHITWRTELDSFGTSRSPEGSEHCAWRWPGQYADDDIGLHYNRFRYYDAVAGGYISADPLGLAGGLNPRQYVADPLTWTDPLGLTGNCADKQKEKAKPQEEADETLTRFGTSFESASRLGRKASEAEEILGIHGVSVSAAPPQGEVSQASRAAVESSFPVHNTPTRNDPLHRTVELPKPVTPEVAKLFNSIFGRSR